MSNPSVGLHCRLEAHFDTSRSTLPSPTRITTLALSFTSRWRWPPSLGHGLAGSFRLVTRRAVARPRLPRALRALPRARARAGARGRGHDARPRRADPWARALHAELAEIIAPLSSAEITWLALALRFRRGALLSRGDAAGARALVTSLIFGAVHVGTEAGASWPGRPGRSSWGFCWADLRADRGALGPGFRACLDQSAQHDLHPATLTLDEALSSLSGYPWRAKSRRGSRPSPSLTSRPEPAKIASW